jgi:hypothetical protein
MDRRLLAKPVLVLAALTIAAVSMQATFAQWLEASLRGDRRMGRRISVTTLGIVFAIAGIAAGTGHASAKSRLERCLARAERGLGHRIDVSAYDIGLGSTGGDLGTSD